MANNLYRKQKRQYSTDNGVTWKDVTPPVYQVGELIEENSDCSTDTGSIQYRWFTYDIDDQYTCDTESHTKYNLEVLQYSYDGQIWQNTTETRRGSQTETNSCDCGYIEYKWNLIEGRYTCGTEDFSKYGVEVYQIGCGNNWTNVEPYQERPTEEPIECYSLDCGMSSNEIVVTTEIVNNYSNHYNIGFLYLTSNDSEFIHCDFPSHDTDIECWDATTLTDNKFSIKLNEDGFPCDIIGLQVEGETNSSSCQSSNIRIKSIDKWMDTTYYKSFRNWLSGCHNIESINLEDIKTENVLDMYNMFGGCHLLTELDLSNFNTSNVVNMGSMFAGCSGLTSLDLSNFDTSNVVNMGGMFNGCSGLRELNLSGWDFSKIYTEYTSCNNTYNGTMNYMFAGLQDCEINLQGIKYDINTISEYRNVINVFSDCTNVTLDMRGLDSTIVGCFEMMIGTNDVTIITDAVFNDGSNVFEVYSVPMTGTYPNGSIKINGATVSLSNYLTTTASTPTLVSIDMNTNYNPLTSLGGLSIIDGIVNFPDTSNLTSLDEMFSPMIGIKQFPKGLFNDISNVTSAYKMFYNCGNTREIDMSGLSAPKLTRTERMFYECGDLEYVNLSGWNTTALTEVDGMFFGCSSLKTIDLSGWDFSNVDSDNIGANLFYGCNNLEEIILNDVSCDSYNFILNRLLNEGMYGSNLKITTNISTDNCEENPAFTADIFVITKSQPNTASVMINNTSYPLNQDGNVMWLNIEDTDITEITSLIYFNTYLSRYYGSIINLNIDTSNVTNMKDMFYLCSGLTSLDLSHFNTSNVVNMEKMFSNCSGLTTLNLNGWNTSAVTNMNEMFNGCSGLTSLDVSHFDTSNVTSMNIMFEDCSSLTSLDVSNFDTSAVTNMGRMFHGCSGLTSLDLSNFDISNVTNMYQMFYDCTELTLNINGWDISNVTDMRGMFANCKELNLSGWNISNVIDIRSIFTGCKNVNLTDWNFSNVDYTFTDCENVKLNECIFDDSMNTRLSGNTKLITVDINNSDTTNVTNMRGMFNGCTGLTNVNISGCNTSNVTDMYQMFFGCSGLTSLDLSGLDTTKVTTMGYMFSRCSGLTSLDVSHFNTSAVTNMDSMFEDCRSLTSLDLSSFDTSNVTSMNYMFEYCNSLTSLDLSSFDTSNVTDMGCMFEHCNSLTSLDLSNFDTSNVTNMNYMFISCNSLTSLNLSGWIINKNTSTIQMLDYCTNLTTIYCYNCNQTTIDKLNSVKPSNCTLVY